MIGLTGLGPLLDLLGWFYWYQAFGFVAAALTAPRTVRGRVIAVVLVVIAFSALPLKDWIEQEERRAYAKAAREYYQKLCAEVAGERIFQRVQGVKSLVVLKPLLPAKESDNFDQFWRGDPYAGPATSGRFRARIGTLVWRDVPVVPKARGRAFEFIEVPVGGEIKGTGNFVRYWHAEGRSDLSREDIQQPTSRYGISWEDISTDQDRKYWVAGSRFRVIDTSDKSIVAERIGYFIEGGLGSKAGGRRPWLTSHGPSTTCPSAHDYTDLQFLFRVLSPWEAS